MKTNLGDKKTMYYIAYGKFRPLRAKGFVDWFNNKDNVKKLQDSLPDGARFVGAFLTTLGHADHDYEIWYEIENYGVIDNWNNKNPKVKAFAEEIAKNFGLIAEWANVRTLKPVSDVVLLDPAIYKKE